MLGLAMRGEAVGQRIACGHREDEQSADERRRRRQGNVGQPAQDPDCDAEQEAEGDLNRDLRRSSPSWG